VRKLKVIITIFQQPNTLPVFNQLSPYRTPTDYVPHALKGNSEIMKLAHTVGSYGVRISPDSIVTLLTLLMQIIKEKLLDWISEIQGDSKRWNQFRKSIQIHYQLMHIIKKHSQFTF
jgi:hypothetical protein